MTQPERYALAGIGLGCAVLGLKALAWRVTGSAALYSDALESIVNVAAGVVALAALHFAARPADANHPYGHGKAEFFAAVIEGALIVVAAGADLLRSLDRLAHAARVRRVPVVGIALSGIATVINGVWAWALLLAGKRLRSATLQADCRHLLADVVTTVGIAPWLREACGADRHAPTGPADRRRDRGLRFVVGRLVDRRLRWRIVGRGA